MDINPNDIGRVVSISYKGRMYDHYGILDGRGGVIHVHKKKNMITCDPLDKVLRGAKKVIYHEDDSDTRWKLYERARALIGSKHNYKFFTDNCECFVQKIRTGEAFSKQVDGMTNTLSLAILTISGIMGLSKILS